MELRSHHTKTMDFRNNGKIGEKIRPARKVLRGCFIDSRFRYLVLPLLFLLFNSGFHHGPAEIKIAKAYVRVAAKGMTTAAYMEITNSSAVPDTLYGVKANFAEMAQIHKSFQKNGMVGMKPVNFVLIPGKSSVEFKPGYYHIMLMNVRGDLTIGKKVKFELLFRHGGTIEVVASVKE